MSQIIEGVHCDVSQQELKGHCAKRVEFHTERLKVFEGRFNVAVAGKQKEIADQDPAQLARGKMSGYSNTTPLDDEIERCRTKVKLHKQQLARFRFWGEHLPEGGTFRLGMSDLATLELTEE